MGRKIKKTEAGMGKKSVCFDTMFRVSSHSSNLMRLEEAASLRNSSRWLSLVPSVDPVSLVSAVNT